jgi:glutamyl-Q tRNA(Asp) synthetase
LLRPIAPSPKPVNYRGRFAPSPTGPLHFGSLIAAVGSYLAARHAGGQWLVRIEDLDPPREAPGSADQILRTLEDLGFEWDETVIRQSHRLGAYEAAAKQLQLAGLAYECTCSRAEIAAASTAASAVAEEPRYPGWCRERPLAPERARALRFRVPNGAVTFTDELQGTLASDVAAESGDFVIRRRDGWFAYQLAVAIDDAAQGVTHVVRGADLLTSTARQILLQRALGLRTPTYAHLPLAVDKSGAKLSKSAGSAALDGQKPTWLLWLALDFLQQKPPSGLRLSEPQELWSWAIQHWTQAALCGMRSRISSVC